MLSEERAVGPLAVILKPPGRSPVPFTLPDYATALDLLIATETTGGNRLRGGAYAMAVCWADPWWDFDTPIPPGLTGEDAWKVGGEVLRELQLAGWTFPQIRALTKGFTSALDDLFKEPKEAQEKANFTLPSGDGSPSSPSISGSSSTATPTPSSADPARSA